MLFFYSKNSKGFPLTTGGTSKLLQPPGILTYLPQVPSTLPLGLFYCSLILLFRLAHIILPTVYFAYLLLLIQILSFLEWPASLKIFYFTSRLFFTVLLSLISYIANCLCSLFDAYTLICSLFISLTSPESGPCR